MKVSKSVRLSCWASNPSWLQAASFLADPVVVDRIITHLGVTFETTKSPPAPRTGP